jgi:hypothetical protein
MWCGRHCREGEGSKVEMVWTLIRRDEGELVRDIMECRNQKMWFGRYCREGEGSKEIRWRWYRHVIRRDEGEPIIDIME